MKKIYAIIITISITIGQLSLLFYDVSIPWNPRRNSKPTIERSHIHNLNTSSPIESESFKESNKETISNSSKLDFSTLISYLHELQFPDGGFQIAQGSQSYMNATYFATLALSLVEDIADSSIQFFLGNASTNLEEGLWGFKNWLVGEVSLKSTSFGILTSNITNSHPEGYNQSMIRYVNETMRDLLRLDPIEIPLLDLSLSTIALHSFTDPVHALDAQIQDVLEERFNENRGCFDGEKDMSNRLRMLQNYFSFLAFSQMGNLPARENITEFITSRNYTGPKNALQGGFGWDPSSPTVFQTGIALEMLSLANSSIKPSIISSALQFVNNSQVPSGGIQASPLGDEKDIFQAVGGLMVYHATQRLMEEYDITVQLSSTQVMIGNNLNVNIPVKFRENNLGRYLVNYSIINRSSGSVITQNPLSFNSTREVYETRIPTNTSDLTFGSYTFLTTFNQNLTGLPNVKETLSRRFRIGFKLTKNILDYPEEILPPSASPQVNVTVQTPETYENTTGTFHYAISRMNTSQSIFSNSSDHPYNSSFSFNYTIPSNSFLGHYRMQISLADSYGSNHSALNDTFVVWDDLTYVLDGNQSEYNLGENYSLRLTNIAYNESGDFPTNKIPVHLSWETQLTQKSWYTQSTYIENGNREFNGTLPSRLPPAKQMNIKLEILWEELDFEKSKQTTLTLYNSNITISGFNVSNFTRDPPEVEHFLLGESLNSTFSLRENETNALILGADLRATITWNDTPIQTLTPYFVSKSYWLNQTLDANLPEGKASITFRIQIPWKDNETWRNIEKQQIRVRGVPKIQNMQKEIGIVNDPTFLRFSVIRSNSSTSLKNLNLSATIEGKKEFTTPVEIGSKGDYTISFIPKHSREYTITVSRTIDDYKLKTLKVNIESKSKPIFEKWREAITALVLSSIIIGYLLIRWLIGRRISRRWMVKRWRERQEKK